MKNLKYLVIVGNAVFVVWLFINGLDESFKGTIVQIVSYLGLTALLILNIFFLHAKNKVDKSLKGDNLLELTS